MLGRYSVVDIEDALHSASALPPFPAVNDRVAWDATAHRLRNDTVARIVHQAELDAACSVPPLPATMYLDFLRTGARDRYERLSNRRREMLWNLALAECLEGQGRFLDPVL